MRYYIIAGEASGDLHGSNLMKGIYAEDPQAEIRFWGGDLMAEVWESAECSPTGSGCGFTDRATPLAAGGGARSSAVGGVVCETASASGRRTFGRLPYFGHQVASPEADFSLRLFCVNAFHQVRAVEIA